MKIIILLLFCVAGAFAQSCAVTSPATGALYTSPQTIPLTISVSSAPTADHAVYWISYRRWATTYATDQGQSPSELWEKWQGSAFAGLWYTGLNGDGLHFAQAFLYDIYGNLLAQCTSSLFTVRIEGMSNQSFNATPTTGTQKFGLLTFDGGGQTGGTFYLDGFALTDGSTPYYTVCGGSGTTSQSGGIQIPNLVTTCFPNGPHLLAGFYGISGLTHPYLPSVTVSGVSTTTITTTTPHYSTTGNIVTFTNSGGALPTGLTSGAQCEAQSSATAPCTATIVIAAGVMTVTTSASTGATTGTPVYVRDIESTNSAGQPNCDGPYTANAGTTGTSILITAPASCPNGAIASNDFEIIVNPYYVTFLTNSTLSVSSSCSPCIQTVAQPLVPGSAISLSGGSGTTTMTQRIRSPYWALSGPGDHPSAGGPAYVQTISMFSNGITPMEIDPPSVEYHGWGGKTGDTLCAIIKNTDLSLSTVACSTFTYTLTADGLVTGAVSVNASTGALTYAAPASWSIPTAPFAWAKATVSCSTCSGAGGALPSVKVTIENHGGSSSAAVTFPHYTKAGPIATAFTPGQSIFATSAWHADLGFSTNLVTCNGSLFDITAASWSSGVATVTVGTSLGVSSGNFSYSISGVYPTGYNGLFQVTVTSATTLTYALTVNPGTFVSGGDVSNAPNCRNYGLGSLLQTSLFNTALLGLTTNTGLNDPPATSCPVWATYSQGSQIYFTENYALQYGIGLEFDMQDVLWQGGFQDMRPLAAIVNNTGYNRHACLQSLISHMASVGNYRRTFLDDESTDFYGSIFRPAPLIGGGVWTDAVVSGSSIVFDFPSGISIQTPWVQSTGVGAWLQIISATNTCLNGWYPMNGVTNGGGAGSYTVSITSINVNGCPNGTYEPSGGVTEATAQFVLSPTYIGTVQNISALPSALSHAQTCWSGSGGCSASGQVLTSIVVSGSTATINWNNHGLLAGAAVRIWSATTANLDVLSVVNPSPGANSFTITYNGTTGTVAPASGTYNLASDPSLFITVDPEWGPNALGQFYSLIDATANAPVESFSLLGTFFGGNTNASLQSYLYPPNGSNAFSYNENGAPTQVYGIDGTINDWVHFPDSTIGIATRAWQMAPRSTLWGAGLDYTAYCFGLTFNPACDRPAHLTWRPESVIAQRYPTKSLGFVFDRLYNFEGNSAQDYLACCGWGHPNGNPYTSISQNRSTNQWNAATLFNALVTQDARWELQPQANKPYYGVFFVTDAHTSATYGNQTTLTCGSEQPYGAFTVNTNAISGGSLYVKYLDGYKLTVQLVAGNPSTISQEWCGSPGAVWDMIAQPPGVNYFDTMRFMPPTSLPFGAVKYLIRVGYGPTQMNRNDAVDCTSGCSIVVDHSNVNAYYQIIYANSNSRPVGPPNPIPITIPSMGLQ